MAKKNLKAKPEAKGSNEEFPITLTANQWIVVLGHIENANTDAMRRLGEMKDSGKTDPASYSREETIVLGAPVLIRAKIVDELVKRKIMTPDAGKRMGIDAINKLITAPKE